MRRVSTGYGQVLDTIFTDCTSNRRSGWLDEEERFCSSLVIEVVPVVPVVAVVPAVVVVPAELEDEGEVSCPVTVTLCPT